MLRKTCRRGASASSPTVALLRRTSVKRAPPMTARSPVNQLHRYLAYSLACVVFFVGLGRLGLAGAAEPLPEAPPKAPAGEKSASKEVSVADAQKWAAALQRAVRVQDVDAFNKLVDWDAFVETATALPGDSAQLKAFRAAFQRGLKS